MNWRGYGTTAGIIKVEMKGLGCRWDGWQAVSRRQRLSFGIILSEVAVEGAASAVWYSFRLWNIRESPCKWDVDLDLLG